jgi:hypothetical protein
VNPIFKAITYLVDKIKIISDKLNTLNTPTSVGREQLKVSVDRNNIIITRSESAHETFALADLEYAIFTYSGLYIQTVDLWLGFPNKQLIKISEENIHWRVFLDALDQSGKIGQPAAYCLFEFVAKGINAQPINLMEKYPPQTNQPSTEISMN